MQEIPVLLAKFLTMVPEIELAVRRASLLHSWTNPNLVLALLLIFPKSVESRMSLALLVPYLPTCLFLFLGVSCTVGRFEVVAKGWAETQGSLGKEILPTLHGFVLSREGSVGLAGSSVIGLHDSFVMESFLGLQGCLEERLG